MFRGAVALVALVARPTGGAPGQNPRKDNPKPGRGLCSTLLNAEAGSEAGNVLLHPYRNSLSKHLMKRAHPKRPWISRFAFLGAAAGVLVATHARAGDDPDPWFGRDKALHFGASAALGAGGYGLGSLLFDKRLDAALLGGAVGLGVGAAKEGADALGLGTPSWRDFTWDVVGTVVGVALAFGLDVHVFAQKAPQGTGAAAAPAP